MVEFELLAAERHPDVEAIWRGLEAESLPSFFLCWDVVRCGILSLPPDHGGRFVVGHHAGRPVFACWLCPGSPRSGHGRQLHVNPIGIPGDSRLVVEHNDVLIARDIDRAATIAAMVRFLVGTATFRFDELVAPGLPAGAALLAHLRDATPPGWFYEEYRSSRSPYVDLDAVRARDGDYFSLLSPHSRQQLRRAIRAYEADGGVELESAATEDQGLALLDELSALHQARWIALGEAGAFADPGVVDFHRALIRSCIRPGLVQLLRLRAGGATVGALYNLAWRGNVLVYQSGFHFCGDRRPGMVTHYHGIRHNLKLGHHRYDFLPDPVLYKRCLTHASTPMSWCRLFRPRLRFGAQVLARRLKRSLRRP
jgi:CelD/BcsL family acetyltransferase involved in cellulose biosynthesis